MSINMSMTMTMSIRMTMNISSRMTMTMSLSTTMTMSISMTMTMSLSMTTTTTTTTPTTTTTTMGMGRSRRRNSEFVWSQSRKFQKWAAPATLLFWVLSNFFLFRRDIRNFMKFHGVHLTTESYFAVYITPQSQTPWCASHRGVSNLTALVGAKLSVLIRSFIIVISLWC